MRRPIKDALRPEVKALPSSGPLSMSQIQGEFGGSNPISLSEYYGAAAGVPSSGVISISDFYGKSDGPPPGQPSVIWDGTGTPPSWLMPSLRITQNASPAPGSPNNIASTTANLDAPMAARIGVTAVDNSNYTTVLNPKMEIKWPVKDWPVSQDTLRCKVKVNFGIYSTNANWNRGAPSHKLYGEPSAGASKVNFHTQAGAHWVADASFTTTQTIYEYIQNGQSLIMDVHWNLGDTNNYNRYIGGCYVRCTVTRIEAVL